MAVDTLDQLSSEQHNATVMIRFVLVRPRDLVNTSRVDFVVIRPQILLVKISRVDMQTHFDLSLYTRALSWKTPHQGHAHPSSRAAVGVAGRGNLEP